MHCGCKHTDRAVVALGSDHGGFAYKQDLATFIAGFGWEVIDVGTDSDAACDFPEFAYAVALAVREGQARLGIMIDGAGPGSAIACNKVAGIRAACVHDEFTAWNARAHNDAHVMTLGSRSIGLEVARRATRVFLETTFEGGRHETRVAKISDIERKFQAVFH
jgi:ribose 5-phosphate isomerase B